MFNTGNENRSMCTFSAASNNRLLKSWNLASACFNSFSVSVLSLSWQFTRRRLSLSSANWREACLLLLDVTAFFNIFQYISVFFSIFRYFSVFLHTIQNFQYFPALSFSILFSICSIFQYISEKTASLNCKLEGGSPPFYRKRCQGKDCEALCFNLHSIIFTKNNGNFTKSSS